MKKLFFMLALVAMSVLAMGQNNQLVWANGRLLYGTPVESIDSLTYDAMQDIDTLHLLLPRTLIKVVHDTVYIHDTVYVETDCGGEGDTPSAGIGVFSVSADKQVTFSKGNLQYTQSTNTWSFASAQWEVIGTDNVTGGSVSSDPKFGDSKEGTALADKVDLFGWSTSATNFGVSTSTSNSDYSGSFVDWGSNQIGSDAPNTWRTLTYEEWEYLLKNRNNASSLRGVAQVNGVNGLILLPDSWTCPAGVTFKSGLHSELGVDYYAAYQTFTAAEWSKLESAGAVFLPASGYRYGSNVFNVQYGGYYWSATESGSDGAYCLYFGSGEARMGILSRTNGFSVRLVKDIEGGGVTPDTPDTPDTSTEPEEPTNPSAGIGTFSVSADKQVTFSKGNLQYHPANDEWRFAENQWDYISDVHDSITQSFNGWIDWFIWGLGANPIDNSSESLENMEFVDWGINKIGKDNPYTWRTLTIDEWRYLRWERENYASLCGIAQVNGVNGLILLPDNWECPDGVTFKSGFHSNYGVNYYVDYQTFSINEWTKLEASGAVFLPASGGNRYSYLNRYEYVQLGEYYHAATKCSTISRGGLYFDSTQCTYVCTGIENTANSVRLVKDL